MAQALKRLITNKMGEEKAKNPSYSVLSVLVDKVTLRVRVDKTYFTVREAALRYGIPADDIVAEKNRYHEAHSADLQKKKGNERRTDESTNTPSPN